MSPYTAAHLLILSCVRRLLLMAAGDARGIVPAAIIEGLRKAGIIAAQGTGARHDAARGADGAQGSRRKYRLRVSEPQDRDAAVHAGVGDVAGRRPVVGRGGCHPCTIQLIVETMPRHRALD